MFKTPGQLLKPPVQFLFFQETPINQYKEIDPNCTQPLKQTNKKSTLEKNLQVRFYLVYMFLTFFKSTLHVINGVFILKYKFEPSHVHVPLKALSIAQGAKTKVCLLILIALIHPIFVSSSTPKIDFKLQLSGKEFLTSSLIIFPHFKNNLFFNYS